MAAELVAGALLSASLQVLFQRLTSEGIPQLFHGKKLILDQLDELNTMLLSANALLIDAENKQLRNEEVRMWLFKLQDVIHEADDLVDRIDYEALRSKLEDVQSRSSASKILLQTLSNEDCWKLFTEHAFGNNVDLNDYQDLQEVVQSSVLSLSESSMKKVPDSICNLKQLRYLDLSYTEIKKLPYSICTLYNLQTLLLSWRKKPSLLPKNMGSLINLRYLDIEGVLLKDIRMWKVV
ncbi:putative disease resistance RPP13-like protein 1 [Humulus lupulus]|uniref:putative disease resistance RPP13-like protein 1 n=1 Tax=Humulus lupulus TaxID=3486 RepID=UPI002B40DDBB|nr:putative disease resistance RPP13-like protein 1 [Humulus lupulus]